MKKILGLPKVGKTLRYMICAAICSFNWEVYIAYSNEEQYHITPLFEGGMITITFITTAFWLILYNSTFSNVRTRYFVLVAILMRVLGILIFA
jgi:uncharacterized membrane protein